MLTKVRDFLAGKKTYITAIIGGIAYAAWQLGFIDEQTFNWIAAFDIPALAIFMRAGIAKTN